ncbi:hypothetical protein [Cytophaga sp. FL35]|uniref:hypothetical protein n=1 Tax=Cytophaga sp. FL35 TaxID=1904456 RepID=UPI0016538301|nr:hypothetical protein [Cytophaga sp. FL35]MBC7000841.1 hypothetical protein [Cytophaga sp. FL35]
MRSNYVKIGCFIFAFGILNCSCTYFCGKWIEYGEDYKFVVKEFSQYRGALCINGEYKIDLAKDNKKPYPTKLYEFIEVGDTILSKANTDTVYVIRSDRKYMFKKYGITGGKKD